MSFRNILAASALASALMVAGTASATQIVNFAISEQEVLAAQKAWGEALVQISRDYEAGGTEKAKKTASAVLDAAYGYNFGPVLFKPTLTSGDQTFRTTKEGALAYFVGADNRFPKDTGFALKGWRSVEIKNAAIFIDGDIAMTTGNVMMTDKDGKVTKVDKTWSFKKGPDGKLRIVGHHSSLPYAG